MQSLLIKIEQQPYSNEIVVVAEYQPHLNALDIRANIGDVVAWTDIKAAYKKRALIVHPDKSGSDHAFKAVNSAFNALGHARLGSNRNDPFGGFALMDKLNEETEYKLQEMRDAGLNIPATIQVNINGKEFTCITNPDAWLNESQKRKEDEAKKPNMTILGYVAFVLGAGIIGSFCINLMTGKHQRNSSETCIANLCGAGLIIGGGLLVRNSFFEEKKPSYSSPHICTNNFILDFGNKA